MNAIRQWLGGLANALGFPGLVRDTVYRSQHPAATVVVRRGRLFTVVCVNGTDVYFNRLSGRVDGVGASQSSDCTPAAAREPGHSVAGT
jgi:hypothetical protein